MKFTPTQYLRPLCLVLMLINMFATPSYAGADLARSFAQEQSRVARDVENLILRGDQVIVYSLDPTKRRFPDDGHRKFFHGFKILGKANIDSIDSRKLLARALANDIRDNTGVVAGCFDPHHGLRVIKGSEKRDLVICFSCNSARSYNFNSDRGFLVSGSSESAWNEFLDRHHIRRTNPKY